MNNRTQRSEPIHVESADQFDELTGDGVVLVDYHADWCGPCQMLAPTVDDLAEEVDDLTVLKVDVDDNQDLAAEAGVRSIPALQFYADGEEAERLVGVHEKEDLLGVVESLR